mmetsp:Transcript_86208/g.152626  ORF Transcript_86208/g.152626 Transcript_86208/m.152626 type:complete len:210 (+) Transcript_86208:69-698(+)
MEAHTEEEQADAKLVAQENADQAKIDPAWEVPHQDESALPADTDGEGWLELLRDGYFRQLREENEWPEPAPFPRALLFAAPYYGQKCPDRKFPRLALDQQKSVLAQMRPEPDYGPIKGGMKGGYPMKGGKGMAMAGTFPLGPMAMPGGMGPMGGMGGMDGCGGMDGFSGMSSMMQAAMKGCGGMFNFGGGPKGGMMGCGQKGMQKGWGM